MLAHSTTTTDPYAIIAELRERIAALTWDATLDMFNRAGGFDAIEQLPEGEYIVVFCDIDKMKALNSATGSHFRSNRMLAKGLRARKGEIVFQLMGDEFVFILGAKKRNGQPLDPNAFIRRIEKQLASQQFNAVEKIELAKAKGIATSDARLTATFDWRGPVEKATIRCAIEQCSKGTLTQKAVRDRRVA